MWYEILLPLGCLFVTTSLPFTVIVPLIHKWQFSGNKFNRYTDDCWVEWFWFRDHHLTGNPFKPLGIEAISDEPPEQFKKKD